MAALANADDVKNSSAVAGGEANAGDMNNSSAAAGGVANTGDVKNSLVVLANAGDVNNSLFPMELRKILQSLLELLPQQEDQHLPMLGE